MRSLALFSGLFVRELQTQSINNAPHSRFWVIQADGNHRLGRSTAAACVNACS